ncbi:hypothetical protein DPMN_174484 [Dreissena polymorpha]|uniref:Uncharacterized protein n=1 Tax=Dreissena polymorpha TaxID=45954 RepID=A0A9D4E770_DREPO|nr:hypothetical protein DPMN_174484 [Dreissena polymorpha]
MLEYWKHALRVVWWYGCIRRLECEQLFSRTFAVTISSSLVLASRKSQEVERHWEGTMD